MGRRLLPGEEVLTHLAKRSGGVAYASTWWNAKGEDLKKPESTQLPTKPGESVPTPKSGVPATPSEGAEPVSPPKHSEPGQPIDL
jgi:hypothetical protein